MNRRFSRIATASVAAILLGTSLVGGATAAQSDLQAAKVATARFHSLSQAGRGGYGPFPASVPLGGCISSLNNTGAMGFHWVNGALLDRTLDATRPEVLVYEPDADGELQLVAVEYVIFQADWFADHAADTMPSLFGEMFMVGDAARFQIPPFFALHAWIHKANPSGTFASYNPNVSCGAQASAGPAGSTTAAATSATFAAARDLKQLCRIPTASA